MKRAQAGDGEAYRELLVDLQAQLRGYLRHRFRLTHDLDDVCQEVLIALHRSRQTYHPERSFDAWFFAIASHVSIDHLRRLERRGGRLSESIDDVNEPGAPGSEGLGHGLRQALDQLPPSQREALRLVQLDGLSMKEAASRAGTSEGAMKVRAHRAFKALRSLLSR